MVVHSLVVSVAAPGNGCMDSGARVNIPAGCLQTPVGPW